MELTGIITGMLILGIIWGGFILFLAKAIIKEKQKEHGPTKS